MEQTTVRDIVRATGGVLLAGDPGEPLENVSIDSRAMKGRDLFVPLIGEHSDAHDYLAQAIENGAVLVLSSRKMEPLPGAAWIQVDDTLKALQAVGRDYRNRMGIPVVGVTGSVGKTTTREMTATVLGAKFRVFKTSKNFNSDIGLPVTMTEMTKEDEIAVLEMGMSDFGEMEVLSSMARPSAAIITNIGVAHIEQLGTQENILREKLKITVGLENGGTLILNGDDAFLRTVDESIGFHRMFYGFGENCQYRAEDMVITGAGTEFTSVCGAKRVRVHLPVMGKHMVMNALAAMAAASIWGVSMEEAAEALEGFAGFRNRQQIYEVKDYRVIDDTYNASPDSMKAALGVLSGMETEGKKIAVLANMLELGEDSRRFHYEVGYYAKEIAPDVLICIGELAAEIGRGVSEAGGKNTVIKCFDTKEEALPFLKEQAGRGDLILFKGSNSMKLGELIDDLRDE
ncbi:UDP-N-acetylmuramoyl-tripeptide--D-alanyl-D-alanine ligase [Qiania dongpingensis]|uniref:UDP-N-acetylmuramoyl-tripeptide--D-alanyl-D-alanine ligase n=1 Tax=Qiania dongpingensis TaxID=2763669 RepID=A0A7G9G5U7_9FIRM|nr:UDP-N-acetylmuramoyl-tripeptide--D-alanyl-D-alanine ligase [Qiania dongpingensis]QNM06179.1 UDP-N-acetylmuramoyl-tripeptide--D-alanyl-D-alanine ligase [Qiania dongpingensis]